ncbi:MAG: Fic family protein [Patescibacteria group bacterium]|nr:MAG: Fic family protein [Patescibacteria group bacterium]
MVSKAPGLEKLNFKIINKGLRSEEMVKLIRQAQEKYIYWDKFKHLPMPKGFTPEEAWLNLKLTRFTNREKIPVMSVDGKPFFFNITKKMFQRLSVIDSNTSGFISTEFGRPTESQKSQLIISGLSEEAIASSQIEGANTSRKVAKEMILTNRKPKTHGEQMIINNYKVMQMLDDLKDLNLSLGMLLDIQKQITIGTLENEDEAGRLRTDEDRIVVSDSLTGEVVFIPPSEKKLKKELKRLINYANKKESDAEFLHPVIKASILHFWLAYLHPFVDGNGRTARAIFYWYLLKHNYWLFQYLSVSRIIKNSRQQYDRAFLYSELDDNDFTYFLSYNLKAVVLAIKDFLKHYRKKLKEEAFAEQIKKRVSDLNGRQILLLRYWNDNPNKTVDINKHRVKHGVAYQTARTDLLGLVEKGYCTQWEIKGEKKSKYEYVSNRVAVRSLFKDLNR